MNACATSTLVDVLLEYSGFSPRDEWWRRFAICADIRNPHLWERTYSLRPARLGYADLVRNGLGRDPIMNKGSGAVQIAWTNLRFPLFLDVDIFLSNEVIDERNNRHQMPVYSSFKDKARVMFTLLTFSECSSCLLSWEHGNCAWNVIFGPQGILELPSSVTIKVTPTPVLSALSQLLLSSTNVEHNCSAREEHSPRSSLSYFDYILTVLRRR